jgi:hypothetical protein
LPRAEAEKQAMKGWSFWRQPAYSNCHLGGIAFIRTKLMSEHYLKILVPGQLSSGRLGEHFLRLMVRHFPGSLPQRFGRTEPLKNRFNHKNLEPILDVWETGRLIAEGRHPRIYFMASSWPATSKKQRHSAITFFHLDAEAKVICAFLSEASEALGADYAMAHPLTRVELEERIQQIGKRMERAPAIRVDLSERVKNQIRRRGYAGVTKDQLIANIKRVTISAQGGPTPAAQETQRLRGQVEREGFTDVLSKMITTSRFNHIEEYLPNLFWMNVFGRPYIEFFGRERLRTASVARIDERTHTVGLRIADRLEDDVASWNDFKDVRDCCKRHLGADAFFEVGKSASHPYRAPKFVFGSDPARLT